MTQSKKFAVTGGIGSGKTMFCEILRRRGYAVFSCDEISRLLWAERAYRIKLAEIFPDCKTGNEIDKKKLSAKVFADEEARRRLNAVAHPAIMARLFAEMRKHAVSFGEVPLLFEQGLEGQFDGIIALRRPREQRIAAIMRRDGLSESEVTARMAVQFDAAQLDTKDCFIIENDGTAASLEQGASEALRHFGVG